jgi:thiosulfate reductase cytochrome b subunit
MTLRSASEGVPTQQAVRGRSWTYRHSGIVRITHWINVICIAVLLMSGLQIFNAHPALYWGDDSDFAHPAFAITAERTADGGQRGVTTLFGRSIETTGVLGLSREGGGSLEPRAFPYWATLPSWRSLADGRRWHFFFAWVFVCNLLIYLVHGVVGGHFRRDLLPSWRDLRDLPHSAWEHLRFRFPRGEAARRYNVLQKSAYCLVVFFLIPVLVFAGLAMSPRFDAGYPQLPEVFGGRQSARTIHFIAAWTLIGFVLVHVFMVLVSGVWNNIRSMMTGRYAVDTAGEDHD